MAEKEVVIGIKVDTGNSAQTLGDLEQEFERLNEEIRQVPVNSADFDRLSKELAQVGKEVKNAELAFESLDTEQTAAELGSVAGAVGDVSAAFVLLGDDSENIQEVAKNIETALGVSMAFKGAIEGITSARKLLNNSTVVQNTLEKINTFIKGGNAAASTAAATAETARGTATAAATTATTGANVALKAFRIALISTGIGAIIVGLGLLIANFDKVKKVVSELPATLRNVAEGFKEMETWAKVLIGIMTFGLVPLFQKYMELLEEFGIIEGKEAEESRKRREKQLKEITRETDKKLELIQKEIDAEKKKSDEITSALDWEIEKKKAAGEDYAELEKQKIQSIIETTRAQAKLLEEQIRLEAEALVKKNKIIAQGSDLAAQIAQKALEAMEESGGEEAFINQMLGDNKDLQALNETLEQAEKDLELFNIKQEKLKKDQIKKNAELQKKANDDELKALKEHMSNIEKVRARSGEIIIEQAEEQEKGWLGTYAMVQQELFRQEQERIAAEKQARLDAFNERVDNSENLVKSLTDLNNTMLEAQLQAAGNDENKRNEIRKKAFKRDKALKLAQATIDGVRSVQAALTIPPPLGFVLAGINSATAIANIAKIAGAKFEGETGASASGGGLANTGRATQGANVPQVTNTTTTIGEPTKVFVSEQDITDTQNKVTVAEQQATL